MEKYLKALCLQYCEAIGINYDDEVMNSLEFSKWILDNFVLSTEYAKFLEYLGIPIDSSMTFEVGKGLLDSLYRTKTKIISPYGGTLGLDNLSLYVYNGFPFVISSDSVEYLRSGLFLVHNPSSTLRVLNWSEVHNAGIHDISIGFYGKTSDYNYKRNIQFLELLSDRMDSDHVIDFDTKGDNYYVSLNSRRKKYVKTRIILP